MSGRRLSDGARLAAECRRATYDFADQLSEPFERSAEVAITRLGQRREWREEVSEHRVGCQPVRSSVSFHCIRSLLFPSDLDLSARILAISPSVHGHHWYPVLADHAVKSAGFATTPKGLLGGPLVARAQRIGVSFGTIADMPVPIPNQARIEIGLLAAKGPVATRTESGAEIERPLAAGDEYTS